MRTDRNAIRAGFFILAAFALAALVVLGIEGFDRMFQPARLHTAEFRLSDNVGGLQLGDPVRIGGYKVGTVRSIDITGTDLDKKVAITFAIPAKYPLKIGTILRVDKEVTGSSALNIEDLGAGEEIAPGAPITGRPSMLAEITSNLSSIAPRIEQIVADVQRRTVPAIDAAIEKVGRTAEAFTKTADTTTLTVADARVVVPVLQKRYEQAADAAVAALAAVRDFIGPPSGDFRATMANLNHATGTLNAKLPELMDRVNATVGRMDAAVQSATAALKDIETVAANSRDLTGAARSLIVGNRGKFEAMIAALKSTSDNLKGASVEIRRSPWRLLYKPTPDEMGNLNLYDTARQFAEGANDLNDSVQALRDAIQSGDRNDADLKAMIEKMHKSFDGFRQVEQKLWQGVKE